jgi:hypothetical protein
MLLVMKAVDSRDSSAKVIVLRDRSSKIGFLADDPLGENSPQRQLSKHIVGGHQLRVQV